MKNFITNNWFRMLIGTSTLIFSVGFFIRSITPSYANNPNPNNSSNVASTTGYAEGNYVYFIDNGYMFQIQKGDLHMAFVNSSGWNNTYVYDGTTGHFGSQQGNVLLNIPTLTDPITKLKRKSHFEFKKISE